jgi:hypothetical protein
LLPESDFRSGTDLPYYRTTLKSGTMSGRYPSVVALVTARAAARLAEKYQDEGLAEAAAGLERRALGAIARRESELSPNDPGLR